MTAPEQLGIVLLGRGHGTIIDRLYQQTSVRLRSLSQCIVLIAEVD